MEEDYNTAALQSAFPEVVLLGDGLYNGFPIPKLLFYSSTLMPLNSAIVLGHRIENMVICGDLGDGALDVCHSWIGGVTGITFSGCGSKFIERVLSMAVDVKMVSFDSCIFETACSINVKSCDLFNCHVAGGKLTGRAQSIGITLPCETALWLPFLQSQWIPTVTLSCAPFFQPLPNEFLQCANERTFNSVNLVHFGVEVDALPRLLASARWSFSLFSSTVSGLDTTIPIILRSAIRKLQLGTGRAPTALVALVARCCPVLQELSLPDCVFDDKLVMILRSMSMLHTLDASKAQRVHWWRPPPLPNVTLLYANDHLLKRAARILKRTFPNAYVMNFSAGSPPPKQWRPAVGQFNAVAHPPHDAEEPQ